MRLNLEPKTGVVIAPTHVNQGLDKDDHKEMVWKGGVIPSLHIGQHEQCSRGDGSGGGA